MRTKEAVVIDAVTIEAEDTDKTGAFIANAFGLTDLIHVSPAYEQSSGFRGFSLSLVYDQPADVDRAAEAALRAGAEPIKPVAKSFWGYGGSLRAPDGTIWTLASSSKKNTADPTGRVSQVVLLAGVADVRAAKAFYTEHGLRVRRSFGSKYVEFDTGSAITLALQSRRAVAKNAGVDPAGSGSHRLVISGGLGSVVDPDGYVWE